MEFKPNGKLNPLRKQPNSVRRWNVPPLYDDQFGYPYVARRRFENGAICQTRQLPSEDTIWGLLPCQCGYIRQDKNRHDKICPWILPRTIAILSASVDRPLQQTALKQLQVVNLCIFCVNGEHFLTSCSTFGPQVKTRSDVKRRTCKTSSIIFTWGRLAVLWKGSSCRE